MSIGDIEVGKTYTGTVRSVQSYGAFVDIGAASDGLVHISQLSNDFIKDANDVVSVGATVEARVMSVDEAAGRFALSLRSENAEPRGSGGGREGGAGEDGGRPVRRGKVARGGGAAKREDKPIPFKIGEELKGTVSRVLPYGVFLSLGDSGFEGLLHQSEVALLPGEFEADLRKRFSEGTADVEVRVISLDKGKVSLTQKTDEERKPFKGVSTEVKPGMNAMEAQFARLGLSSGSFAAAASS